LGCGLISLQAADLDFWVCTPPIVLVLSLLEIRNRHVEREILTGIYAAADSRQRLCPTDQKMPNAPGAVPSPSVHPELVINLIGPFVLRFPDYDLGDLACGRTIEIEVIIANHSLVPSQVPISLTISPGPGLESEKPLTATTPPLASGDFFQHKLKLFAKSSSPGGVVDVAIVHADQVKRININYSSIFESAGNSIVNAVIARFPGASLAAFAWRGDMDLYDTTTFQSTQGLGYTLALAARYRFPQTLYLSTRLTLDAEVTENFYHHFGVDRGQAQVPEFIAWMKKNIELRHMISYPFRFVKPFAFELGNHMHHHYGTDASAAPENGWTLQSGIGAGVYPWMGGSGESFDEQRDNAWTARRLMEEVLGFTPKSWAMPDSTNDRFTPAAVEAAGCEVLSDANASAKDNVLFQPPPHHPSGTAAVELTKRYPGDPQDYVHYAMFLYWLHRAHRLRIPVVFMCHHHLRLYEGYACTRFTEAVMRYVLTRFNGDLHINTVYGLGIYWREFFSPQERKVEIERVSDRIRVRNKGLIDFENVPLDLKYKNGQVATILISLPAGTTVEVDLLGQVSLDIS
jgi:hypothetical protein